MTDAVGNIMTLAGEVIEFVEGNTVLLTCFCATIAFTAISVVKKLVGRY